MSGHLWYIVNFMSGDEWWCTDWPASLLVAVAEFEKKEGRRIKE